MTGSIKQTKAQAEAASAAAIEEMAGSITHIEDIFDEEYRFVARYVTDHPGDTDGLSKLITELKCFRARTYMEDLVKACLQGVAIAEAEIAASHNKLQ